MGETSRTASCRRIRDILQTLDLSTRTVAYHSHVSLSNTSRSALINQPLPFSYSESCDLCACNVNSTIEQICPGLMRGRRPSSSPMLFPAFPMSPVTMGSTTNNYMTVEEVKEFMLIEQKVGFTDTKRETRQRNLFCIPSLSSQQVLSVTEVQELIKKFDQSTEAKECTEMGVDGQWSVWWASPAHFLHENRSSGDALEWRISIDETRASNHHLSRYDTTADGLLDQHVTQYVGIHECPHFCSMYSLDICVPLKSLALARVNPMFKHWNEAVDPLNVRKAWEWTAGRSGPLIDSSGSAWRSRWASRCPTCLYIRQRRILGRDSNSNQGIRLLRFTVRDHQPLYLNILSLFWRYPLFLNLENHCSNKQQVLIAKLLTDTFGSRSAISVHC